MEATYSLSQLFEEAEFDVKKGCTRYGSKEAFFSILNRFTLDADRILNEIHPNLENGADENIRHLSRWSDRLRGILAGIGAINLAWKLQSIQKLLDKKRLNEFIEELDKVLPDIDALRKRIINAEKSEDTFGSPSSEAEAVLSGEGVVHAVPHRADFEKLFMLIDNFELDSAAKAVITMMQKRYGTEIDQFLADVYQSLGLFDYPKAIDYTRKLLDHVNTLKEPENQPKKTILAIDDVPGVLLTIEAMLKDTYKVYCMTNYAMAVKFLTSGTVDLILLDIEMPGMDGFAMIQLFRSLPEYADTPVVFLTSHSSDEHIKTAVSLGACDFIRKPVDVGLLLSKLEKALSKDKGADAQLSVGDDEKSRRNA